jgi:hypothetical protein
MGRACSNRLAWAAAPAKITAITAQADALLTQTFPAWNDNEYLAWTNSGSLVGETMMANRKAWLYPLVLAECAAWQGKYLAAIDMVLQQLATQRTWSDPQQDTNLRAYNEGKWFMDLMSAAMAHELAQALYLLGDKVSPQTRQIVLNALEARVFAPVRKTLVTDVDGWWLHTKINWNAVILCDVVGAALTVIESKADRALFANMGEQYIPNFISEFPESGYGIEGPGYWTYGVKHLAVLRHRLYESSAGRVDLLRAAKTQAISLFSARMEMTAQGTEAPFGDTHIGVQVDPQTRAYVAAAYGTGGVWPGNVEVRVNPWHMNDMPLVEASLLLTESVPWAQGFATSDFAWPGLRSYFSDVGVLVTRPPAGDTEALAATIKSAGNGNHGHDDVGSYALGYRYLTPVGDIGMGDPAARTFSPQRRTIKWINSYGHPVPVVGGRLQIDATTAANTVIATNFTNDRDDISINMAPAYALPAGWSLVRRLANDRVARSIAVTDEFSAFATPQSFEVPITTLGTWTQLAPNRVDITFNGTLVKATIEASAPYSVVGETVTDDGLTFQRIAIRLDSAAVNGWVRVTYTR